MKLTHAIMITVVAIYLALCIDPPTEHQYRCEDRGGVQGIGHGQRGNLTRVVCRDGTIHRSSYTTEGWGWDWWGL